MVFRRLVVAAALAVPAVVALSACSAGQITQTDTQVAAVPGASENIDTPTGSIGLRNLLIAYKGPDGYPKGGTAPLEVRIFNESEAPVTLTGVSAGDAGRIVLTGGPVATPPTASASPSPSVSATAEPTTEPTAEPTTEPTAEPGQQPLNIRIDPGTYALLVPGQGGGYLRLVDLAEELKPGMMVTLTFTFDNGLSKQIQVPMGLPTSPPPRATPDEPVDEHE